MRDVAIIGAGITKFGELWNTSFRDLFVDAGARALEDAGLGGDEIDALYVGNMSAGQFIRQEHIGSLIADHAGLIPAPCTRVEAACASGGLALREAFISVGAGINDIVVAGGIEKMTDLLTDQTNGVLGALADREWEAFVGTTYPGLYALMARRHMHKYGTTREQMAKVAVKNHKNGALNPYAQYQREITVDHVLNSPLVADPLTTLDSSPISDGGAALVLASADIAKEYTDTPIIITGSGQASGTLSLHDRKSLTEIPATVHASEIAYRMAGVKPEDIDVAEVHDCFTIAEIMATEDLGFCGKGEGGKMIEENETEIGGKIPINTSGGLKSKGHPLGATGIAQAVEIVTQLKEEAGKRQVDGVEIGLTHNIGGSGGTGVVHIFERGD